MVARARGEDASSEPESSRGDNEEEDEDGEEGEVTPPPHYLLPEDLPSLGNLFSQQARIAHLLGGFVGSAVLADHQSCRDHDGEAVHVRLRGCRAPVQQGMPLVFLAGILLVCAWFCPLIYIALASPVSTLTLKGSPGVTQVVPHQFRSFTAPRHIRQHPCFCPWWCRCL
jgi:hypothetical protein